jgi:hypothetical protein
MTLARIRKLHQGATHCEVNGIITRSPARPQQHVIENQSHLIEVRPGSHGLGRDLLGRKVIWGANGQSGHGQRLDVRTPSESKVYQHPSLGSHDDIGRFDVPVKDAQVVQFDQAPGHPGQGAFDQLQASHRTRCPGQPEFVQGRPLHKGHDQNQILPRLKEFYKGGEVGGRNPREEFPFPTKPLQPSLPQSRMRRLDGNNQAITLSTPQIHLPHPPLSQEAENLVARELLGQGLEGMLEVLGVGEELRRLLIEAFPIRPAKP